MPLKMNRRQFMASGIVSLVTAGIPANRPLGAATSAGKSSAKNNDGNELSAPRTSSTVKENPASLKGGRSMIISGYVPHEACAMLDLCIQLSGDGVHKDNDKPDYQGDWEPVTDRKGIVICKPFDNAWALWKRKDKSRRTFALVVRGTVPNTMSIIEDLLAESVAANGTLDLGNGNYLPLTLVQQEVNDAAVHIGFVWGMAVLLFHKELGILSQTLDAIGDEEADIFITGHSQGAAIATLMHSFLYYAGKSPNTSFFWLRNKNFKSYAFAQPKPGNWQYAMDLATIAGNDGLMHCINNPLDWVPQVPFAWQDLSDVTNNPIEPYLKKNHLVSAELVSMLEGGIERMKSGFSHVVDHVAEWSANLGANIDLTKYCVKRPAPSSGSGSLNYVSCGVMRSTPMRQDLSGIMPQPEQDSLAQHHSLTYKTLLGC